MKKKKTSAKKIKKATVTKKKKVAAPKKNVRSAAKKSPVVKKKVKPVKAKKAIQSKKKVVSKPIKTPKPVKSVKPAKPVKPVKPEKQKKPVQTKKKVKPVSILPPKAQEDEIRISASGKIKVQFEYYTRSSVGVLYNSFSNASGLAAWFADNVDVIDNVYTFSWDGSQESAYFIEAREDEYVRFRWSYQPSDCYFEFRIKIDSITNEVALVITDFVDKGEEKESQLLWDSQVHQLMHILGS